MATFSKKVDDVIEESMNAIKNNLHKFPNVVSNKRDEYIEDIREELMSVLYPGENFWYGLEKMLDSSSHGFWQELDSMSVTELIKYLEDPEDEDIEIMSWDGCSALENMRRSYVTYLAGLPSVIIREHYNDNYGVDIANEDIILE